MENYQVIKQDDREWSTLTALKGISTICSDDDTFLQRKWTMFATEGVLNQTMRLADKCLSEWNQFVG